MTRRAARFTITLYPLAFRRRYGDELQALLDQTPIRPHTLLDLLLGALDAHLRPYDGLTGALSVGERLRASASGVLACWVVFAAAGFGFAKATEDPPYSAAGNRHELLAAAHVGVQLLAVVASLAVVAGALPLILSALGRARRDRRLRRLLGLPVLAVAVYAGLTTLVALIARSASPRHAANGITGAHLAGVTWALAGVACGAVCVLSSRRALFAIPVSGKRLLGALVCGTVVTVAMIAIALTTAVYAIALQLDAPRLAASANGPLGFASTNLALGVALIVMLVSGALATVTTCRGWGALVREAAT